MTSYLTGGRVWLDEAEITGYLRTGAEPLAVVGDQVVFTDGGRPWAPGETGIRPTPSRNGKATARRETGR